MIRPIELNINTDNDLLSEAFGVLGQLQAGDVNATTAVVGSAQTLALIDIAKSMRKIVTHLEDQAELRDLER